MPDLSGTMATIALAGATQRRRETFAVRVTSLETNFGGFFCYILDGAGRGLLEARLGF